MLIQRIRDSRLWKLIADLSLVQWIMQTGIAIASGLLARRGARMHGTPPLESWLLYGFGVAAVTFAAIHLGLMFFKKKNKANLEIVWDRNWGPEARLTVKNNGKPAEFMATATIKAIKESANNERRFRSFGVAWIDSGSSTIHIPHDGLSVLRLAEAHSLNSGHEWNEMNILESRAEGVKSLEPFRWATLQGAPPEVTLEVSVVRVDPPAPAHKEDFVIEGYAYGGIRIISLASKQHVSL